MSEPTKLELRKEIQRLESVIPGATRCHKEMVPLLESSLALNRLALEALERREQSGAPSPVAQAEEPRKLDTWEIERLNNVVMVSLNDAADRLAFFEAEQERVVARSLECEVAACGRAVDAEAALSTLRGQIEGMREWLTTMRDHQYTAMRRYTDWKTESGKQHWNIHEHKAASFQAMLTYLDATFPAEKGRDHE